MGEAATTGQTQWGQAATQIAAGAIPAILGLAFSGSQDRRQLRQQRKLNLVQMDAEMALADYQQKKQMENWKMTGPVGQMEEYKKAGLNPGLMYGMGGGGGQSVGGGGGSVGSGTPAQPGGEVMGAIGMAMQMKAQTELLQAQKENIQADTKNKLTGADYTAGPQTNKTNQDTKTSAATEANTASKTTGQNLQNQITSEGMSDTLQKISAEAVTAIQQAQQSVNNTTVSDATIKPKIKIIQQEAIGKVLDNALTKAQTGKTMQEVEKIKAEMRKIAADIEQGWQRGNNEINKTAIMERLGTAGLDLADRNAILQSITGIMGKGLDMAPKTTNTSWWSEGADGQWQQGHSTQQR